MTTLASDLIDRTRGALEDFGHTITDRFTGDASTTIWQSSRVPIKTNSDTVTIAGVATTGYSVNYNNGEFTFGVAPGVATVQIQYTNTLYRDERILELLGDGIRAMYPYVYKTAEAYIACSLNKWNYELTSTTDVPVETSFGSGIVPSDYSASAARADLAKPQTRIHKAELLRASTANTTSWQPFTNFTRGSLTAWETDTAFIGGDVVKLIYSAPCTPPTYTTDTIDVPDAFIALPVWYTLGTMLDRKEAVRVRFEGQLPAGYGVMSTPAGAQQSTGNNYLQMFWTTLKNNPMRPMSTEIRKRTPAWARQYR